MALRSVKPPKKLRSPHPQCTQIWLVLSNPSSAHSLLHHKIISLTIRLQMLPRLLLLLHSTVLLWILSLRSMDSYPLLHLPLLLSMALLSNLYLYIMEFRHHRHLLCKEMHCHFSLWNHFSQVQIRTTLSLLSRSGSIIRSIRRHPTPRRSAPCRPSSTRAIRRPSPQTYRSSHRSSRWSRRSNARRSCPYT